jgi:hypothetical protein
MLGLLGWFNLTACVSRAAIEVTHLGKTQLSQHNQQHNAMGAKGERARKRLKRIINLHSTDKLSSIGSLEILAQSPCPQSAIVYWLLL